MGLGGLLGSLVARRSVAGFGSRATTAAAGGGLCAALPSLAVAPSAGLLLAALVVVGALDALMDVAMNEHGVAVEHRYERPILSGLHAAWSTGAAAGAGIGSLAAAARVDPAVHLALAGGLLATVVLVAARAFLPPSAAAVPRAATRVPRRALGLLGLLALLVAVVEGASADWSAVYLRDRLGAPPGVAGAAFTAFALALLAMRLAGDRAVQRWGPGHVARAGGLVAAGGMTLAAVAPVPAVAIVGFAVVGAGVSSLFPVMFAAAARLPGLPAGAGIATASLVARLGFLAEPPLIGALAEGVGLRLALGGAVAAALGVAVLARAVVPTAAFPAADPAA